MTDFVPGATMYRAARILLSSACFAALAACDPPHQLPETPPFAVSAEYVLMGVGAGEVSSYEILVTSTAVQRLPKPTVSVEWGSEWLSAELTGSADPYKIVVRPKDPALFTAPGSYGGMVVVRAPGIAGARNVSVYADVAAPSFLASTHDVRFQTEPGGAPPAARTVLVTPVTATAIETPLPTAVVYDLLCFDASHPELGWAASEWIEAAVTTSGAGYAVTFTPVAAALAVLPLLSECRAGVGVSSTMEKPLGGTPGYSSASFSLSLKVQGAVAPLLQVSEAGPRFSALVGAADPPSQMVTVVDALGGTFPPPDLSVSDPWLAATLVGKAPPYVVKVETHAAGLPAGTYYGSVTVGAPGSASSDRIGVTLEVENWARAGNASYAMGLSASALPDGRILVAGGRGFSFSDPGFEICDPHSPAFVWNGTGAYGIGRMATPRSRHTVTTLSGGVVLAAGGVDPDTALPVGSWELYDPSTGNWWRESPLANARFLHTATLLGDGRVLVAGGAVGDESSPTAIADAEILDPSRGTSTPVASMSTPRRDASAVYFPWGNVLVVGGQTVAGAALDTAEVFDATARRWVPFASLNEPRSGATVVLLDDGRVLAAGGTDGQRALATAEIWDPSTRTWSYTRSMSTARLAPGVKLPSGNVLLVGGLSGELGARVVTGTVERFEPRTETWWSAGALHVPRTAHAVAVLPAGLVVVAGGTSALPWDNGTLVSDVEIGFGEVP